MESPGTPRQLHLVELDPGEEKAAQTENSEVRGSPSGIQQSADKIFVMLYFYIDCEEKIKQGKEVGNGGGCYRWVFQ